VSAKKRAPKGARAAQGEPQRVEAFDCYGFERIDAWFAAHERFSQSLDPNSWLGGMVLIYREQLDQVRYELSPRRRESDSIRTATMLAEIARVDSLAQEIQRMLLEPNAALGEKFRRGRRVNTGGPIRKAIALALKRDQDMKPREIWAALAANPPRGWAFNENRLGRYIEGPKASDGMKYARFSNICNEERAKIAGVKLTG
jgi:hypothetical protein